MFCAVGNRSRASHKDDGRHRIARHAVCCYDLGNRSYLMSLFLVPCGVVDRRVVSESAGAGAKANQQPHSSSPRYTRDCTTRDVACHDMLLACLASPSSRQLGGLGSPEPGIEPRRHGASRSPWKSALTVRESSFTFIAGVPFVGGKNIRSLRRRWCVICKSAFWRVDRPTIHHACYGKGRSRNQAISPLKTGKGAFATHCSIGATVAAMNGEIHVRRSTPRWHSSRAAQGLLSGKKWPVNESATSRERSRRRLNVFVGNIADVLPTCRSAAGRQLDCVSVQPSADGRVRCFRPSRAWHTFQRRHRQFNR